MQDHGDGEDDACLEAAAGAEVAVELHVECKERDDRDQQLGSDTQHNVVVARGIERLRRCRGGALAEAEHQGHADACGEDNGGLAQRVKATIAGKHGGDDVGRAGLLACGGQIDVADIGVGGGGWAAEVRQAAGGVDQKSANSHDD